MLQSLQKLFFIFNDALGKKVRIFVPYKLFSSKQGFCKVILRTKRLFSGKNYSIFAYSITDDESKSFVMLVIFANVSETFFFVNYAPDI